MTDDPSAMLRADPMTCFLHQINFLKYGIFIFQEAYPGI